MSLPVRRKPYLQSRPSRHSSHASLMTCAVAPTSMSCACRLRLRFCFCVQSSPIASRVFYCRYTGSFDAMKKIIAADGFGGLYRGLSPTIMKQATNQAVRFRAFLRPPSRLTSLAFICHLLVSFLRLLQPSSSFPCSFSQVAMK